MLMSENLDDLPPHVRATLEREVFLPARRIAEMLRDEETVAPADEEPTLRIVGDATGSAAEEREQPAFEGDEDAQILVAGGWETETVERLDGLVVEGGLFTSRGPIESIHGIEYKPYNEDGAVLGELPARGATSPIAFAGVADQAGGMGHLIDEKGAPWIGGASAIAVASLAAAAQEIHRGIEPEAALRAAVRAAHQEIIGNNPHAGTTLAGAVIVGSEAHVISVGDSEVWHIGADGEVKHRSETDSVEDRLVQSSLAAIDEEVESDGLELSDEERMRMEVAAVNAGLSVAHILDACIGGSAYVAPHYTTWKLERGDYLVFGTDGLGDANLQGQKKGIVAGRPWRTHHSETTAADVKRIVHASDDAEAVVTNLKNYALRQMSPPNLAAYGRALAEYCDAEEALDELAELAENQPSKTNANGTTNARAEGSRGPRVTQRAIARAQAAVGEAGAMLELASGDGKPDNIAIVALRVL
ncbi:MAG: protein phosphatase 2C domain-containing protein [Deltaproteobacteria bacterium]|nr:protein phosphatase 2C domain-containing protein [Deltaproteobacteria bacterium]